MKWVAVKVLFEFQDKALAADLIAMRFYSLGLKGVVIEDPVADPDEDWGADAVPQPEQDAVTGYLPRDDRFAKELAALEVSLGNLGQTTGIQYRVVCSDIDEEDWAHAWKAFFFPERVGRNLVVKPTWRDYAPGPDDILLEIDPGMAFGTGTHPTTAMCIALLEDYLQPGCTFLDVGTGSGILLAAAAKLGAGLGRGIDNDPLAVEIAGANLRLNGADTRRFEVARGDLVSLVTTTYDLVTANILSDVIVRLLDDLPAHLSPGGIVITSGIITKNQSAVTAKMASQGLEVLEVRQKEGWVAIVGRKTVG
jgi:ribosomal protein L11 methyltransferase